MLDLQTQILCTLACKRIMSLPIPDKDPVSGKAMQHRLDASSLTEGWNNSRDILDRAS
ncbi:MAG: hypothetical protein NXI17_06495 [Alphaproteobacteria bacterium]|nr:hypothetical protein [Alphaproteobacteria bacterium]